MKTNITLLFFGLLIFVTSGCSKTESFFQARATEANPSTERPHRYFSVQTSGEEELLKSPKELCKNSTLQGLDWANSKVISVTNNGYSFAFRVFSGVESSGLPKEFAILMSVLEYDSDGRPYLTCPTIPGPSGTFSIPGSINGIPVLLIADGAFSECKYIEHLVFPKSLESIERCAFKGCENLQDLCIPANVQEVASEAFMGCTNLKSVQFEKRKVELYIGPDAFADCNSIKTMTIPKENVEIERTSFKNAFDLSSMPAGIIRFGNWCLGINGTQIDTIDLPKGLLLTAGFYSDLQKLEKPFSLYIDTGSIAERDKTKYYVGSSVSNLTKLCSLTIGPHVIGWYAVAHAKDLRTLTLQNPDLIIGRNTFTDATNLVVQSLPNEISAQRIADAFSPQTIGDIYARHYHRDQSISYRAACAAILGFGNDLESFGTPRHLERISSLIESLQGYSIETEIDRRDACAALDLLCYIERGGKRKPKFISQNSSEENANPESIQRHIYERRHSELIQEMALVLGEKQHEPCAWLYLADRAKEEENPSLAVANYQKAAIAYAKNYCARLDRQEILEKIAYCIQTIDSLGWHSVAESLMLKTQELAMDSQE